MTIAGFPVLKSKLRSVETFVFVVANSRPRINLPPASFVRLRYTRFFPAFSCLCASFFLMAIPKGLKRHVTIFYLRIMNAFRPKRRSRVKKVTLKPRNNKSQLFSTVQTRWELYYQLRWKIVWVTRNLPYYIMIKFWQKNRI